MRMYIKILTDHKVEGSMLMVAFEIPLNLVTLTSLSEDVELGVIERNWELDTFCTRLGAVGLTKMLMGLKSLSVICPWGVSELTDTTVSAPF